MKKVISMLLLAVFVLAPFSSLTAKASNIEPDKVAGPQQTYSFSFNTQYTLSNRNTNVPVENIVTETSTSTITYNKFYMYLSPMQIFTTEKDVYAYKVAIYRTSFTQNTTNLSIDSQRVAVGTKDDLVKGTAQMNDSVTGEQESVYWIINDFADGEKMYISLFCGMTQTTTTPKSGTETVGYPKLGIKAYYNVNYAKYSFTDYSEELFEDLQKIITEIEESNTLSSTQITKLSSIITQLEALNTKTTETNTLLTTIHYFLQTKFLMLEQKLDKEYELIESIKTLITESTPSDSSQVDNWKESTSEKNEQIDNAVEESNKLERPNADDAFNNTDVHIDGVAIRDYGILLSTFTTHPKILKLIMISLSVGLCAYVLFGKR